MPERTSIRDAVLGRGRDSIRVECKVCGAQALLVDGEGPEEKKGKPARTHWDMLMERRTREELEEVLAERLAVLRSGTMNIAVHPRDDSGGSKRKSA